MRSSPYAEEETKGARLVLARRDGPDAAWTYGKPIELGLASSLGNPVTFFDPMGTFWLHFVSLKGGYWDKARWYGVAGVVAFVTLAIFGRKIRNLRERVVELEARNRDLGAVE